MCITFSHNFKNITQKGQNQSCDTIALKRRHVLRRTKKSFDGNNFRRELPSRKIFIADHRCRRIGELLSMLCHVQRFGENQEKYYF